LFGFGGEITVHGFVFSDTNKNGKKDSDETGIKNVCVSNGRDVVQTNANGEWILNTERPENIFVIKPEGYSVSLNENNIPIHFYKSNPENSEINKTQVFSFPLIKREENNSFSALFFGDPQARGLKEVNYIFHDVVEELVGTDAAFGVSLGDIVADDPELMDDVSAGIAKIGIPWYSVFGNHDSDRDAKTNDERDNTFERFFGPSTYAFEYAQVVFIALNNIYFNNEGRYRPHFTPEQLSFVKNYLQFVSKDKLIVLMMHAPIVACNNRDEMFSLLDDRKYTFSISGHVHEQINLFAGNELGWNGEQKHHHLVNATVCGSWWCGLNDELGIPHATMNDGAPNGYSVVSFEGNKYSVRFKAARRPDDYQMNIYLPEEMDLTSIDSTQVLVNVFAGSERSVVEMSIDNSENWFILNKVKTIDPECLRMHNLSPYLEKKVKKRHLDEVFGYGMDYPSICTHMWAGTLPGNIEKGTHLLTVRTTDMYNNTWTAHRIFRVQ